MARALPIERLHAGAVAAIRRAAADGDRVAVACSGGADSVALVCALWAHLPELRGRWVILHFDHALRGRASAADARFVAALARGLGERCVMERWRHAPARRTRGTATAPAVKSLKSAATIQASAGNLVSESAARDARFSFFSRAMEAAGARVLVLGHQADDVIETMLMRLVRGSGSAGLAAPRPVHRRADGTVRVRPLLAFEGEEIRAALRAAGVPWREDATNAGEAFLRNRMRRRVLPELREAAGRAVAGGFLAARQLLEDDDAALEAWLTEIAGAGDSRRWLALAGRPRALARRAVHAWLLQGGLDESLGRAAVEQLIAAIAEGRPLRLSAGPVRFVVFDGRALTLETAAVAAGAGGWGAEAVLRIGDALVGPAGAELRARRRRLTANLRRDIMAGRFSPAQTVFLATAEVGFLVRQRQPGDRYRPLGAPGRKRLQDLFVDAKVPRERRDALPVVCTSTGIPVWVPGFPPAHDLAVQSGTNLVVQLTYTSPGAIVRAP